MMNKTERVSVFKNNVLPYLQSDSSIADYLIGNGFFDAPASTCHHGAYEGGLFDHSYAVMNALIDLSQKLDLTWDRGGSGSLVSPTIVGFFHDLCKIDAYNAGYDGSRVSYTWNEDQLLKGHGEKSVMLLSQFITLTEEEIACIRYHMGAYEESSRDLYGKAIEKYPNVLYTHTADMIASRIKGV